jgi:hypothetical protein
VAYAAAQPSFDVRDSLEVEDLLPGEVLASSRSGRQRGVCARQTRVTARTQTPLVPFLCPVLPLSVSGNPGPLPYGLTHSAKT